MPSIEYCGNPFIGKFYYKDCTDAWIELSGLIKNIKFENSVDLDCSLTVELDVTHKRILSAKDVPPEDYYEEWERMVLNGTK